MALILARYEEYYIKRAGNYEKYEEGYRAYFDSVCREFVWLKPEDISNVSNMLIPLPIISEYEAYRSFLRMHGFERVIRSYDSLNEIDFCIAVRKEGDATGFLPDLYGYFVKEIDDILQQWITDNDIENCKITWERYNGPLVTREDIQAYLQFTKGQVEYEKAQEEDFKKSRL